MFGYLYFVTDTCEYVTFLWQEYFCAGSKYTGLWPLLFFIFAFMYCHIGFSEN
jgi:hypothetical protein